MKDFYRTQQEAGIADCHWEDDVITFNATRIVTTMFAVAALMLSCAVLADETIYTVDDGVYIVEKDDGTQTICYDLGDGIISCEDVE
jgi:hypothetical protein